MCKKSFLFLALLLIGSTVSAQGVLEVTDISQPNDVYSSASDEAAVIIRCHESIPLRFSSSMDKSANPFHAELQGTDSVYYIAFPTGSRYRGRELTIYARGFSPVSLSLELQPKQLVSYQVTDPNALVDAGCYREHRNKGVQEIQNMNYAEARNQFIVARDCSDVDQEENEKNIALADSLILYREKGETAYMLLDYAEASKYYSKVLALNAYDTYASNRNTLCVQNFAQECSVLFSKAEYYYTEKEYTKAKELYEQVINKECINNVAIATERVNAINSLQRAKKDHSRVLTYEYRKDVPIGFSTGKYNMHKAGGFFQMDINSQAFDAMRGDCQYGDEKFPELNMAFGWTIKIVNPVWIHFGPGFTGKMYYGAYKDDCYPTQGYGEDDLLLDGDEQDYEKANFAAAISPVIGVTVKYSYFAFRLTYQYRWSIQSKLQDFIGQDRLSVGIGVAF